MLAPAIITLLHQEADKVSNQETWTAKDKVLALADLLGRVFFEATRQEQIAFSTFFSRICYAGQRYNFPKDSLRAVHQFRIMSQLVRKNSPASEKMVLSGLEAVHLAVDALAILPATENGLFQLPDDIEVSTLQEPGAVKAFRVVALGDNPEHQYLIAKNEVDPSQDIKIRYGVADRNEHFQSSIDIIRRVFGFPVTLSLLEVEIDAKGYYIPRAFVIEPDYLMDVSAISECFKDTGPEPYAYLVRKFLPHETSEPILLGNIANFFLDRLLTEVDVPWQSLFLETFQRYPFVYAPMTDSQVKSISGKAQKHFLNLKNMAKVGFKQQGIDPENCVLEPAFFSTQYGIQGRLDLFYRNKDQSAIIELKSGTPYKPNSYGIARSHFTQTLLYDLLVRSVFGKQVDPLKYILYSGVDINHLRFAPTIVPEQLEALKVRNTLVAMERLLTKIQPGDDVVALINKMKTSKSQGFTARDYARFEKAYDGLDKLEKKYFNAFTGFIAREHWLAKVGEENSDTLSGHASLWRSSFEEKLLNFNILSHLEIIENHADQLEQNIVFKKTKQTNTLANFRVGDIAVLYPALSESDTVLQHQIIKCTITKMDSDLVEVKLRFQQHNLKPFDTKGLWCLEPDMLDSGFVSMYRGLLEWAEAGKTLREKVMGIDIKPAPTPPQKAPQNLIEKIAASSDFFLLWGPPGTGKTSVMLRDLAAWVMHNTTENLLLLAYTNRAVDEICEALEDIGGDIRDQYLRIGGKHATAERFSEQLLVAKTSKANNRAELRTILDKHRIFVSTVASFSHNEGLLKLKKFHRLVVDEASQILEPQLIGLLTRFDHFTLIGDHRQLPAVTTQRSEYTQVEDADLNSIGIVDLRDSYFERLYKRCKEHNWHWAYDQLERQGRMHEAIMDFPGKWFYDNKLQVFNVKTQKADIQYKLPAKDAVFGQLIAGQRVVFIPVKSERPPLSGQKTSADEALFCARIVRYFMQLWKSNKKTWESEKTLGIICPWRAQIAQIRAVLTSEGIDPNLITVDTVERYQGGARDIIIISTCVHTEWQLSALLNISNEGVDRKLNVALTRAREHLIMLGNPDVLQQDERYRKFMEQYTVPAGAWEPG